MKTATVHIGRTWDYNCGNGEPELRQATYEVKWEKGPTRFKSYKVALAFYESLEPESDDDSKALWEIAPSGFSELIHCHTAKKETATHPIEPGECVTVKVVSPAKGDYRVNVPMYRNTVEKS